MKRDARRRSEQRADESGTSKQNYADGSSPMLFRCARVQFCIRPFRSNELIANRNARLRRALLSRTRINSICLVHRPSRKYMSERELTDGTYLFTSLSISRSESAFVNSVSIYHESWRSRKKLLKNQRTIAWRPSISRKREISLEILKDSEKLHVDCSVIHKKWFNDFCMKNMTVTLTFIDI